MNLFEIVTMRGFKINKNIKLVRHQSANHDTKYLHKLKMLDFYQSLQSNDVFGNCEYILSFLGQEGNKAIYIGAYKVDGKSNFNKLVAKVPDDFPYMEFLNQPLIQYDLKRENRMDDLIDRLVIEWGNASRSWFQWLTKDNSKSIVEVLPDGYVKDFPGFDEILLTFDELYTIINNPVSNRIWHTMLSSVSGVYLITDLKDGNQYVGSASGNFGILGRWMDYAKSFHGGNTRLISLLNTDLNRYKHFQYSILRTLPKSLTKNEVFSFEQNYKQKLGTRAFGLNGN